MALELKVERTSLSADGTTMVVTDITGNYNVSTNPTGYEAPNETRANLYLLLLVYLRKSTGREAITVPSYNENTATTWSLTIAQGGWYEIYLFGCKVWSNAITYASGHIVFDVATDTYYKSLQNTNLNHTVSDTAWWIATNEIEDFVAARVALQPDTYEVTENVLETYYAKQAEAEALLEAICDQCDDCSIKEYEKFRMKIEGAEINFANGNRTEAQKLLESIEDIVNNC